MKGVLIGSDLMYRQDGKIVPVEINTNVGWDDGNRIETLNSVFDLSYLKAYIATHNITDVFLEGRISKIRGFWTEDMGADVHVIGTDTFEDLQNSEDSDGYLYIRSSYSDEAYVDNFCRDKVNFLKAIQDRDYGCEFILRTEEGLEGEITHIVNNGGFPNFIVKYRYPHYNNRVYPKFLNFTSLSQLHDWVEENLEEDYFIMPFYYNEEKGVWNNSRLKLIRNWSVWVANDEETLDSIYIGQYTKVTGDFSNEVFKWDEYGNPVDQQKVHDMLTTRGATGLFAGDLLVEEDDVVLMEDGTWKTAKDLEVGDIVKTVTIPTEGDVDIREHIGDYNISFEELQEKSEFSDNRIEFKTVVEGWIDETSIFFTDGTDWFDSDASSYPTLDPEDGTVMFKEIRDIKVGDQVILMPIGSAHLQTPEFVVKVVERLEKRRVLQKGYSLTVSGNHLFLSRTSADAEAYISIEHNAVTCRCEILPGGSGTCTCQCMCDGGQTATAICGGSGDCYEVQDNCSQLKC